MKFRVDGEWRVGGLYRPARTDAGPAVLMLHGFPGIQKNDDIAAELCRRGMTVLMPYFRGCWGSAGRYSLHGMLDDARAGLRLLARYRHVDAARVGILGCSVGGWAALKLAAGSPVAAVAAMAPAFPRLNAPGDEAYLRRNAKVVNIPRFGEVWREYLDLARGERPEDYLPRIAPAPLLILQGLRDRMVPASAVRALWAHAGSPKELLELPDEDHEFQNDRPAVISAACGWLQSRLSAERVQEALELADVAGGD